MFSNKIDALRLLREASILTNLPKHANIVELNEVIEPTNDHLNYKTLYYVFQIADTDLQKHIRSEMIMNESEVITIMY